MKKSSKLTLALGVASLIGGGVIMKNKLNHKVVVRTPEENKEFMEYLTIQIPRLLNVKQEKLIQKTIKLFNNGKYNEKTLQQLEEEGCEIIHQYMGGWVKVIEYMKKKEIKRA